MSQLVISSKAENVSKVESFIEDIKERYEVGDDVYGNIIISVTEAVNNAIIHGNKRDESKNVTVISSIESNPSVLSFTIKDEGVGFDHNKLPDPTSPENLTMIGGRGVFLIKQLADWVIFSDGGSTIEIQFKI